MAAIGLKFIVFGAVSAVHIMWISQGVSGTVKFMILVKTILNITGLLVGETVN